MNAFVVFNPVAGQDEPKAKKELLRQARSEGLWTYDLYETTGEEDLREVVRDALEKDYDLVVACGGDGTVSGVADGLNGTGMPLGILPGGTVNALSVELGIPKNLAAALDLILGEHRLRPIDAIEFDDRLSLLEISFGVSSSALGAVSREEKDKLGWLAYVGVGISKLIGMHPISVDFDFGNDEGGNEQFSAAEVALINAGEIGIVKGELDPDIVIDDGVLDLYAIRSRTLWDFLQILYFRLIGQTRRAPHMRYWPVKDAVRLSTQTDMDFQADGDVVGTLPQTFRLAQDALEVIVPAEVDDA
ncbi:NAD(+)/NADH kinase [bacterium]|nr:NAD(+)/NADH kinase [bacterium]